MHGVIRVFRAPERPLRLFREDSRQETASWPHSVCSPLAAGETLQGSRDVPAGSSLVCTLHQQDLRCLGHLAVCAHLTCPAALQGWAGALA